MFDILYTHPDFMIINKHPNVSVHKDDGDTMLVKEVAKQSGDAQLYLVHRLDKMTSGILLLARNSQAASQLSKLFAERQVQKFYLAIGAKKPKKKQGVIIGDMERSRRSAWKLINQKNNPAITQFLSQSAGEGQRLFLCKPYTGKTHQIRVALKSIGSAIVGDPIYNARDVADRGYLHAFCLGFTYQAQRFEFICDPRDAELNPEQNPILGSIWHQATVNDGIADWLKPQELNWPTVKA